MIHYSHRHRDSPIGIKLKFRWVERSMKSSNLGVLVTEDSDSVSSTPRLAGKDGDLAILVGLYGVGYFICNSPS